jgi:hypothetical protein
MPCRDVHRPVSGAIGLGYSSYRAHRRYRGRPAKELPIAAEAIGGFAGGWLGGALPDIIDPPTSPQHRNFGHGVATVAGVVTWTADALMDLQERLRSQADRLQEDRWQLQNDFDLAISTIAELALRFLAGLLDGLIAGYVTHLALDFWTPGGIPLIFRGL